MTDKFLRKTNPPVNARTQVISESFEAETEPGSAPVFGFLLLGGTLNGAQIHDIRLANELHRRG